MSIDDQRYAALTLQSLRVTIGPLQASTTSLESQESYLTAGMLPYSRNVTLQQECYLTNIPLEHSDFYRLHSTFARLYNAAASPASRLRSAGSLAINIYYLDIVNKLLKKSLRLKETTIEELTLNFKELKLYKICTFQCLETFNTRYRGFNPKV